MAKKKKKKNEGLSYLQVPLPQGQGYYRIIINWLGLNKKQTYDAGVLSEATNVCLDDAPYLSVTPAMKEYIKAAKFDDEWNVVEKGDSDKWISNTSEYPFIPYPYDKPYSIHAFDDTLLVVYSSRGNSVGTYSTDVCIDYIHQTKTGSVNTILTGILENSEDEPKCITQFNAYYNALDPITSGVTTRLVILPDKRAMLKPKGIKEWPETIHNSTADKVPSDLEAKAAHVGYLWYGIVDETFQTVNYKRQYHFFECVQTASDEYAFKKLTYDYNGAGIYYERKFFEPSTLTTTFPDMDYAVSHQSRLYGVGDGRVFVSGYNDYANWNLDTADEYNESNAWCSPAQSNIKADKDFTGIIAFKNHVVCFKKNFVHEIYNTKNPFRLVDVYSEGAIDNRSIQEVNGNLIFVSENNVMVYTGSTPKILGYELGIDQYEYAVAGTDERRYYLYCRGTKDKEKTEGLYVYDTLTGAWTERSIDITPNEDCEKVIGFAHNNRGMFMLGGDGRIYKLDTGVYSTTDEDSNIIPQKWSFETELITRQNSSSAYTTVDIKHIKKLQMLAEITEGSFLKIYALYDGEDFNSETSHLVYDSKGKSGMVPIRVKLRQSAHYSTKLHVEGEGMVRFHTLMLDFEKGGDLYV